MDLPDYLEQDFVDLAHNPIGILVLCIIAPIAEEYLIRGLMMRKMLRWNISPWYAIIASSIMFGLIHLNPAQIPGPIILGIVMAWMCYRTRSLNPGIIIHITNNTLCRIPEECYDNLHRQHSDNGRRPQPCKHRNRHPVDLPLQQEDCCCIVKRLHKRKSS